MTDSQKTSVEASIVVDAPIDHAFEVFTQDIASWWPPEHHILESELDDMVFEPRQGGHVYDRGTDGSVCRWARVLTYEPPERVVFSWDISVAWQVEGDPERTSEVEVRFMSETAERTRVVLVHRNIHHHGRGWEQMRDAVGSPEGWTLGLRRFAERLEGSPVPRSS
ncbi:MAG: SRPBCC family protein [Acidimicrobiales bacterium]